VVGRYIDWVRFAELFKEMKDETSDQIPGIVEDAFEGSFDVVIGCHFLSN
jgi:hypothetical protein